MSKKERIVYDVASIIFILLFVSLIIVIGLSIEKFESRTDLWNGVLKAKVFVIIYGILALIYTIAVLFLIFKKEREIINLVFMIIGSFVLIGVLPFIYYFSHLRKMLGKEQGSFGSLKVKLKPFVQPVKPKVVKQQIKPQLKTQPKLQPKKLPKKILSKVPDKNAIKSGKTSKVSGANRQTLSKVPTKSKRK